MNWADDSFASLFMKGVMFHLCSSDQAPHSERVRKFDESKANTEAIRSWFRTGTEEKVKLCKMLAVLFTDTTHSFHLKDTKIESWARKNSKLSSIVEHVENIDVQSSSGKPEKLGSFVNSVQNLGDPKQTIANNLKDPNDKSASHPPSFTAKLSTVLPRCFAILWCMKDRDWSMKIYRDESLLNEQRRKTSFLDWLFSLFRSRPCELTMSKIRLCLDFHWLSLMQSVPKGSDIELSAEQKQHVPTLEAKVLDLLGREQIPETLQNAFTRIYLRECIDFSQGMRKELSQSRVLMFIGATTTGKTQQIQTLFEESNQDDPTEDGDYTTDISMYTYNSDDRPICVLDTPGLFDPNRSLSNMSTLFMSSLLGVPINVVYNVSCSSAQIQKNAFNATKVLEEFLKSSSRSRGRLLLNLTMFDEQYMNIALPNGVDSSNVRLKYAYTVAYVMQRIIFPEKKFFLGLKPQDAGLMYTINVDDDCKFIGKLKKQAADVMCTGNNFSCAQAHLEEVQDILNKYDADEVSQWKEEKMMEFAEEIKDQLTASLTLWDGLPELYTGLVANTDSSASSTSSVSSLSSLDSAEAVELVL